MAPNPYGFVTKPPITDPFTTSGGGGNPFTPPPTSSGGTSFGSLPGGFADWYFNQNPGPAVGSFLANNNFGPLGGSGGRYLRYATPYLYDQYSAQSVQNPNLNFMDFLQGQGNQIRNESFLSQPLFGMRPTQQRRML